MQHGTTERQALFPSPGQCARDQVLLAFEIGHFQRPIDTILKLTLRNIVETGKQPDVLNHLQVVIQRKFLGHVPDVLANGFGLAAHVVTGHQCPT